jgi:hypothetical protein
MPTIDLAEFVTVHDIPVLETGIEYPASTGPFTVTSEMIAEVVEQQDDPHIDSPKIKISHGENPINDDLQTLWETMKEGEEAAGEQFALPNFGTWQNLRASEDGGTLIGDAVGLPAWLAAILETAYPARSIEGGPWTNPANNKQYNFMIDAVALLGVIGPGCTSLADLQDLFSEAGPKVTVIEMSTPRGGHVPRVAAQINVGDIRRAFYEDFAQGDRYWWWDRELLVNPDEFIAEDPDENQLWRVPFTLKDGGDDADTVEFGDPEAIKIKYVPDTKAKEDDKTEATPLVSAQLPKAGRVLAVNHGPRRTRERSTSMDPTMIQGLRGALGLTEEQLPDDATDEQVTVILAEHNEENGGEGDGTGESGEPKQPAPEPGQTPEAPSAPATTPSGPQTDEERTSTPDGMTLIDNETLEQLKHGAEEGIAANARYRTSARDEAIKAAVGEGKFPPSRVEHYTKLWDADPEGTKNLLASLATGVIPVTERGEAGSSEGEFGSAEAYPEHWLPEVAARASGGAAPSPITHERDPRGA